MRIAFWLVHSTDDEGFEKRLLRSLREYAVVADGVASLSVLRTRGVKYLVKVTESLRLRRLELARRSYIPRALEAVCRQFAIQIY